ncbi:hypothetical protein BC830DRAFT_1105795 [Chytriomyces sp. MP71]|nr:hypothetical protein BC830DRAFT_1105795 [Chytriomyces sp. MP71]
MSKYRVLNLATNATQAQIKSAFIEVSMRLHPDRLGAGLSETERRAATDKFLKVKEAYEVLKNRATRAEYDASFVHKNAQGSNDGGGGASADFSGWSDADRSRAYWNRGGAGRGGDSDRRAQWAKDEEAYAEEGLSFTERMARLRRTMYAGRVNDYRDTGSYAEGTFYSDTADTIVPDREMVRVAMGTWAVILVGMAAGLYWYRSRSEDDITLKEEAARSRWEKMTTMPVWLRYSPDRVYGAAPIAYHNLKRETPNGNEGSSLPAFSTASATVNESRHPSETSPSLSASHESTASEPASATSSFESSTPTSSPAPSLAGLTMQDLYSLDINLHNRVLERQKAISEGLLKVNASNSTPAIPSSPVITVDTAVLENTATRDLERISHIILNPPDNKS